MIATLFPLIHVAHAVTISMAIPGTNPNTSSTSPGAFVANMYQFALAIGGVLAFGIVVYGGVKYMTSAGNPSGQGDAKEWIEAALLGLLLLVGAYFILTIINPQLTNLALPPVSGVNIQGSTSGGSTPAPAPTPTLVVCNGVTCSAGQLCLPTTAFSKTYQCCLGTISCSN